MALYRAIVRRIFHLLYHEFAWTFDAVAWIVSGGLWRRWVLTVIPELQGRVLEIGFGTGHLQMALADRPGVVGVDASPYMVRIAAARLRRHGYTPRLVRGLAQALPFPDASFDTVVATFPAEYILDPVVHHAIRRVVTPNGRLIVVPMAQFDPGIYARLIDLIYRLALLAPVCRNPQAAPPPIPFQIEGMRLSQRWIRAGPSQVMIVVGEPEA